MAQVIFMESSDPTKMEQQVQKFPEKWNCAVKDNCNQWPMAKVLGVNADDMGFVLSVRLLLASSCDSASERILERPVHKRSLDLIPWQGYMVSRWFDPLRVASCYSF